MHHLTAVYAGSRANVDHPVRSLDGVFIMFNNDQGVAKVTQFDKCLDQTTVITLVKTNAWLVKNIEHAG